MSVPAWKQAILERKRQQEEAEKKKHLEKEQYYASLPPWKRAMLKKKEEGAATTTETKEERVSPLLKQKNEQIPAWKQARTRKDSGSSDDNQAQRDVIPAKNSTATEHVSKEQFTDSIIEKKSITNNLREKFEQQSSPQRFRKIEVKQVTVPTEVDKRKEELPKPSEKEEEKRSDEKSKPLQKLKGQFEQQEGIDKFRRPSIVKTQTQSFGIDDEKIKTMPKWKQDLLLRKQHKTTKSSSPISKTPPQSDSPTTDHKVKSDHSDIKESNQSPVNNSQPLVSLPQSSSSPVSKNAPVSFNHISTQESKPHKDNQPEIVNASDKKVDSSPKLLHKEGKELKPPVYQMKSKWADMMEDDPEFKNLPAWKQNLIMRRKNDFKNRTAPPIIEKKEEKPKEEVNQPLPGPLWTPTRTVTTREIPKQQEKTEDTNPLLDMRKNLRKVSKQKSQTNEILDKTSRRVLQLAGYRSKTGEQPFGGQLDNQKTEETEEMESVSPLKENSKKPKKKLRRVSWSDTDLQKSLTMEFTYPKYSYEDYFEIDQRKTEKDSVEEVDSNELATPLHPWLSPSKTNPASNSSSSHSSNIPSDLSKPTSFGMSSNASLASLGSFMTAYTGGAVTTDSYNTTSDSSSTSNKQTNNDTVNYEDKPVQYDDNTAALLW